MWGIAELFSATLPGMMLFSPSFSKWTSCNCNSSLLSPRSATAVSQLYCTCPSDSYSPLYWTRQWLQHLPDTRTSTGITPLPLLTCSPTRPPDFLRLLTACQPPHPATICPLQVRPLPLPIPHSCLKQPHHS